MEEKKYYTPTYNDLVNGLEYEELRTVYFNYNEEYQESDYTKYPLIEVDSKSERFTGGKYKIEFWDNRTVDIECGLIPDLEENKIRVPCLCKKDIEELGWRDIGENAGSLYSQRVREYIGFMHNIGDSVVIYLQSFNQQRIVLFQGILKNKRRLSLVMEMVGIIQRGANL